MITASRRDARLGLRLSREHKIRIAEAAALSGQTVTDFITRTALRKADEVVAQHEQTVLSDRDRDLFLALLENPPAPNAALLEAIEDYKKGRVEGEAYRWNP